MSKILIFGLLAATLNFCTAEMDNEFDKLAPKIRDKYLNQDTGSGACYVGKWRTANCGGAKTEVLQLNNNGTGYLALPDCQNICEDLVFPFNYTVAGNMITLQYTTPPKVYCTGFGEEQPPKPNNDILTFTCSGNTLTTTANGSKTYTK